MQKTITEVSEIKLVGITSRTNNQAEIDPTLAQIGPTIQKYFQNGGGEKIHHRKKPNTTYCVYTEYENGVHGDYTYFIGEEVTSLENISEGFVSLTIPPQTYAKFTTDSGIMPDVCINAWQKIWRMSEEELGGKRTYHADFEIYDERAPTRENTILDIFIGIEK